jgi:type I restriction enzyme M protein
MASSAPIEPRSCVFRGYPAVKESRRETVTGELKSQIDSVWNDIWSGGVSIPLEVMEQLTYLLFIKALDERQTLAENKANRTGNPIVDVVFPDGEFKPDRTARAPYEAKR